MKKILLLFCFTLFADDVYDYMPDSMYVMDSLLVTVPEPPDYKKYDDFKSISINQGKGIVCYDDDCEDVDTVDLPSGVLISDAKAYEYLYNKSKIDVTNRRLIVAKELFREYNKNVNSANVIYNKEIQRLQESNKRSWWERNNIYIGFVIGVVVTIVIEAVTVQVLD